MFIQVQDDLPIGQAGYSAGVLVSDATAREIGGEFVALLAELRHLGALFALFEVLCLLAQAYYNSARLALSGLPLAWLQVRPACRSCLRVRCRHSLVTALR